MMMISAIKEARYRTLCLLFILHISHRQKKPCPFFFPHITISPINSLCNKNFYVLFFLSRVILKKRRIDGMKKKNRVVLIMIILILCVVAVIVLKPYQKIKQEEKIKDLTNDTVENARKYANDKKLKVELQYVYDKKIKKDRVISQNMKRGTILKENDTLILVISKGKIPKEEYQNHNINELGKVPIMMYHGIINQKDSDTSYTLGNVDKDGYNRTAESFRRDLEFYYQNNYRMIRLTDFIDGKIDVEFGKSPIILTFDDGREDNFKVLGKKDNKLEIDPNCAVGILEEFKKKYPDFHVTATFFLNEELFNQEEYNKEIITWLVEHGYDIGNHTLSHPDFTKISVDRTNEEVGGMYHILDNIIQGRYVNIVALPFGSPYKKTHGNFSSIMNSTYQNKTYETKAALRVGWEAEVSCFHQDFDPAFLKRIRAYDNNGKEFDIEMNFKLLENTRYISDGDESTIVIKEKDQDKLIKTERDIITY